MKAAVVKKPGLIEVKEVPVPTPGPGEVLIRVKYCGICGSDLHYYDSHFAEEGGRLGHEYAGEIAGLGEGVEGWKVGDRVSAALRKPCGQCHWCKMGHYHLCLGGPSVWAFQKIADYYQNFGRGSGAYAEYVKVPAWRLISIPDEVSFKAAAQVEPLSVALQSVRQSGIRLGDNVAILGAGPIGLLTLQCAKHAGALNVFVSEGAPARAAAAAKLGADVVLNPREVDVTSEIIKRTEIGPDIVFECAAVPATIEGAVDLVRRTGKVMILGVRIEPVNLVTADWILKQVSVEATLGGNIALAMQLLGRHIVDAESLVTDIVPLEGIQDAFQSLLKPSTQIKVLVEP